MLRRLTRSIVVLLLSLIAAASLTAFVAAPHGPKARLLQAPVLQISKSAFPSPVEPGDTLYYTIVYTNAGAGPATSVLITETYPANTTYLFAEPPPNSGNYVWSIGSLAPGMTGTITVLLDLADEFPVGSMLTNTVRIGADLETPVDFTLVTPVNSAPDIGITKSDSRDPVRVGETFVYTIRYSNDGNALATGIRITETYPSQVTFQSANPLPSQGNNVWTAASLGGLGQSRFIHVTVRANSPLPDGTLANNQVVIDTAETAPVNTSQTTLIQAPAVDLSKAASPNSPTANSLLTYTLRYTNSGSTYATAIVTDAVPASTAYQSCVPGCSVNAGIVTWNLGQVPASSSGSLVMVVRVNNNLPNNTRITNTARISAIEGVADFVQLVNTVTSRPALQLTKSDGVTSAAAAQLLTYALAYTNSGTAPARNVTITDRIPSNVGSVSCLPPCTPMGGGLYSFTLSTLNAGNSGVVTVGFQVDSPLPAGLRAITNTARIRTTTNGDLTSDNFDQDVDTISTVPVLALSAGFDSSTPYPTKRITHTIAYTNTSAMHTTGVALTATKSPSVTYVNFGGWTSAGGGNYTRVIGNLNAGASGTATFIVELPYPYDEGTEAIVNTFRVTDGGPGGLPVASAIYTATLGIPDLIVESVKLTPSAVTAGMPFAATIVIRNRGTGRACNPDYIGCGGGFDVDVFLDPPSPPPSSKFQSYGDTYVSISPINPGLTRTVVIPNLTFGMGESYILYVKVDNHDCAEPSHPCIPDDADHGLVPESDEENNVFGPINVPDLLAHSIYLPIILKTQP